MIATLSAIPPIPAKIAANWNVLPGRRPVIRSGVGSQQFLKIAQLARGDQPGQGKPGGAAADAHLHRLQRLAGAHGGSLVEAGGAFAGQLVGQARIAQVQVPIGHLQVEPVGEGAGELREVLG